jgi:hypothetical protein
MFPTAKRAAMERDEADAIALQGLAFLAEDEARFLAITGMDPAGLRDRVGTPELNRAVLEHLAGDESLLLVFAATSGIDPERIAPAIAALQA